MVTVADEIIVDFERVQILQSSHTRILLWCWVDFLFFPFKVYIFKNLKTGTIHLKDLEGKLQYKGMRYTGAGLEEDQGPIQDFSQEGLHL